MRFVFGSLALLLSLLCVSSVGFFAWASAIRLKDEGRDWSDYPALLAEHWGETAIAGGLLLLGFVLLIAGVQVLVRSDLSASD